jgi:hypothetical protein
VPGAGVEVEVGSDGFAVEEPVPLVKPPLPTPDIPDVPGAAEEPPAEEPPALPPPELPAWANAAAGARINAAAKAKLVAFIRMGFLLDLLDE